MSLPTWKDKKPSFSLSQYYLPLPFFWPCSSVCSSFRSRSCPRIFSKLPSAICQRATGISDEHSSGGKQTCLALSKKAISVSEHCSWWLRTLYVWTYASQKKWRRAPFEESRWAWNLADTSHGQSRQVQGKGCAYKQACTYNLGDSCQGRAVQAAVPPPCLPDGVLQRVG